MEKHIQNIVFVFPVFAKAWNFACQRRLATDRSLKSIPTDSNRGGRKVGLKSVYAFSDEMSACSEATKMGWQKYSNMFYKWKENISVCFQLAYQLCWLINHHIFCIFVFQSVSWFTFSFIYYSLLFLWKSCGMNQAVGWENKFWHLYNSLMNQYNGFIFWCL